MKAELSIETQLQVTVNPMQAEARVISVAPDSELGQLLEEVGAAPVILEKEGEFFTLAREDAKNIWAKYDPERVREALRQCTGVLAGVDRESLLSDIHVAREQDSNGRPNS